MNEVDLPDGYSLEKQKVEEKDYTILYKKEAIILALPIEHCPSRKIKEVIQSTKKTSG